MANEFKVKNGLIVNGDTVTTGSVSASVFYGDGSFLENVKSGSVFITDITPQSPGQENVGEKVFSSDGEVLDSCSTTTEQVVVSILALPGYTNYKPVVTILGTPVSLVADTDAPKFTGAINVDLNLTTSLTVIHEDGADHTVAINRDTPPTVQTAIFTGGYPGTQTELKAGDQYNIQVTSDIPFVKVELSGDASYATVFQETTVSSGTNAIITATIADRGVTTQDLPARVRVQKSTGAWSDWFLTNSAGSTNGTHTVKLNNLYPSIQYLAPAITYPASQSAIRTGQTATINHNILNANTYVYSSPTSELSISNPTVYESNKNAIYNSGTYNITQSNFRVIATRTANNASTTSERVVQIANVSPTINITIDGSPSRLRSGGNDGTSAQNYTVRVTSNQNLYEAPSLSVGTNGGIFTSSFTGGPAVWTRTLQVHDDDPKGSYSFTSLAAKGLAGLIQNTINSGSTYTLGGFVSRQLSLPAFANEVDMNVAAETYNKVILTWSFDSTVNQRAAIDSSPPIADSWCLLSPIDSVPVTIRILDTASTDSSSQASTVTIEETI